MKKILSFLMAAGCVAALTACGKPSYSTVVLEDKAHACYCVMGGSLAWDYAEGNVMTATSVSAVSEVSKDLADKLAKNELTALYMKTGVEVGKEAQGWTTNGRNGSGEVVVADGSLTLKTGSFLYDEEDDVYLVDEWLPSPEHYGESLTPSALFMPPHREEPDEAGIDHNSNPVILSGAGVYTIVVAKYKAVKDDGSTFGLAVVQTSENKEGQQVQPVEEVDVESVGLIGSFEPSNWESDVAFSKLEDGLTWELTTDLTANDQFKVRLNGEWTFNYSYAELDEDSKSNVAEDSGNMKAIDSGKYTFTIKLPAKVSVLNSAPTSFTVSVVPAN